MWGDYAIEFVLAFIISFMATPYMIKLAYKIGAVDVPKDERRMHKKQIPKFGGPAVILRFIIASSYTLISMSLENAIDLFNYNNYFYKMIGFLIGILILAGFTVVDDIKPIKPLTKLIGQSLSAIVVILFGITINDINIPFIHDKTILDLVYKCITFLWIIGVTNAINLIDGLDGLSSGITAIAAMSLLVIFILNGSPTIAIVLITALTGALIGFLPFNFNPAKTFLGDTGSNFLGFSIAVISMLGVAKSYTFAVIVLPVITLGLPIFDTLMTIFRRIKKGKSIKAIFKADKGHLHHKLVSFGFSQKQAVLVLYGIAAFCGIFSVILFESGIYKAISFLAIVLIAVILGYNNFSKNEEDNDSKYECLDCKYIYNPRYGNPKQNIQPGTSFAKLPQDWVCPVCGETKERFEQVK